MWAAKEGSTDVLAVLLALPQTRINDVDADGDTALAHAAANGRTQVRKLENDKGFPRTATVLSLGTITRKVVPDSIRIQLSPRIRIQAGQNWPPKGRNFMCKESDSILGV
jgi:hypothetical protein